MSFDQYGALRSGLCYRPYTMSHRIFESSNGTVWELNWTESLYLIIFSMTEENEYMPHEIALDRPVIMG